MLYRTTINLGPVSLAPLLEALTRQTMHPNLAIYWVKLESEILIEDDLLPMSHCKILPPLCPLQAETAAVDSQQGLPCGSITMRQEMVVDGFQANCHFIQMPHPRRQGLSTYEVILSDHSEQSMVSMRYGLLRSPRGLAWYQKSGGSMPLEDAADGSMSQAHATSNNTLPHDLTGKCKTSSLIPSGVWWGIIRTISEN